VPGQDPLRIENLIKSQIRSRIPKGASVTFSNEHKAPAYLLDREHPLVQPALNAIREGFKIEPLITKEGGSIPIVTNIAARTRSPVLLIGFGQITDNWHGPNEKFALCDFHRGMRTSAALIYELMNHSNYSF
jgi:succinyl-diaminopimelate desuccinylase